MPTNDTCGPLFNASSPSADLQRCLESRLRARMDVNGSPEYELTWKEWDMPSGLPICALRASGRRTSGKGFTGWPTPNLPTGGPNQKSTETHTGGMDLEGAANLSGWPTPNANKNSKNSKDPKRMKENGVQTALADAAHLSGWPTPRTEHGSGPSCGVTRGNTVEWIMKCWPTPRSEDSEQTGAHRGNPDTLNSASKLSGWLSPADQDWRGDSPTFIKRGNTNGGYRLPGQVTLASGPLQSGTDAEIKKPGGLVLNPRFSLWLQGYPEEWASSGVRAMQSIRNSRRRSSKP